MLIRRYILVLFILFNSGAFAQTIRGFLLTGDHHPGHHWEETTPVIKQALEKDGNTQITITHNIEDLADANLTQYDFLILNYCNWKDPKGLSKESKTNFVKYLKEGGGLLIIHFANGAWHYSLPEAGESDWPEYRKICHAVWDHDANSAHDKYGEFVVEITNKNHPITKGISSFETKDELYYNQTADKELSPLLEAKSIDTGQMEPLAWAYNYHRGKVFQTLLGHSVESLSTSEVQQILRNAANWVSR